MNEKAPRGRFVTLEGGEGAGKSTQARLLAARIDQCGYGVLVTREPGGSPMAEAMRGFLLSGGAAQLGASAEAILFSAARIDHLDKKILPALQRGDWVICDRFMDSTRAYQGASGDLDRELIDALERIAVGDARPDLTLILDLPVDVGHARAAARRGDAEPDRFEGESAAFHATLRQAFLDIAKSEPERCAVIDAEQEPEQVAAQIWAVVRQRFAAELNAPAAPQ